MVSLDDIPVLENFKDVVRHSRHVPIPEDWFVLLTDVRGSTKAIEGGRYKEVNVVGASSIIAVVNAVGEKNAAFVFGGDGATFLVGPDYRDRALEALVATREMARQTFQLELRVGVVPVADLVRAGHELRVARFRLSGTQVQTMLSGDGVAAAEDWIKSASPDKGYVVGFFPGKPRADYTGLECRWEPVPARKGEVVAVLVSCPGTDGERVERVYNEVIEGIEKIYGDGRPVTNDGLELARAFARYREEAGVRTFPSGKLGRFFHQLVAFVLTRGAAFVWDTLKHRFGKRYKNEVVTQSDYRKFDGVLRMVLDGNPAQREKLVALLSRLHERGEIAYGIHVSGAALMTCLIFERFQGRHLHFLDGAQGGYAEAARGLKTRLAALSKAPRTAVRAAS